MNGCIILTSSYFRQRVRHHLLGAIIIEQVRDPSLSISMGIAKGTTKNQIKASQYMELQTLSSEQKELVFDLLSETITGTIFHMLNIFDANEDKIKMLVIHENIEYDLKTISEVMGGEIALSDEDGWIQKFSKLSRYVL